MLEVLNRFFTSGPFIPHGHCYLWQANLVGLHLTSDLLIALAYYSIPITLFHLVRKRSDLPYPSMFLLFGAFITACGTTHVMEIWTLWHPNYWLSGFVKSITALISVYTAATLLPLVPQALALPSPSQLEAANRELEREIVERKQVEIALQQARDELEIRVEARTAELVTANEQLLREIAEREQVQEALRQSEIQNRAILGAIPDLLLRVNRKGSCLDCKIPKDSTAGFFVPIDEHLCEVLPPELLQRQLHRVEQASLTGELQVYEHQLVKQGKLIYEELRITAIGEDEVLIMVRDITARKQLEDELRQAKEELEQQVDRRTKQLIQANLSLQQSEVRYRAIVEDQTELITRFGSDGILTFVNEAYCRYFGVKKEELLGNRYEPLIFEGDREQVARLVNSLTLENPVVTIVNRVVVAGRLRWTQWINRIVKDERGQFVEFQSVGRDITELKQAEAILTRSRDFYLSLFEEFPVPIWRSDIDAQYNYFNKAWLAFTGRSLELEVGEGWAEGVHWEDLERCSTTYLDAFAARQPFVREYRLRNYEGSERWLVDYGTPFYDLEGNFAGYLGSCYDISDRKQAEASLQKAYEELELRVQERTKDLAQANQELQGEIAERERVAKALRESEQRLQLAIEGAEMGTWDWDLQTGKVLWSAQHFKILGYESVPSGEVIYEMWCDRLHPDDAAQVFQALEEAKVQRSLYHSEYRIVRADDGQIAWLAAFGRYLYNETGQAVRCIGVISNATERKRAEEQIKASLREKEVLLQEIHHRVKNNLQVICSLLNLQSRKIEDPNALEILKESQNRIRSMALIHEKLYQSEDLSRINFAEYIRYLAANLFRSYGVDTNLISLKTEISNRILLDVDAAVNCGFIVNELISNSLKYAFKKAQAGIISVKIQLTEKEGLVMTVSDNGAGLPTNFEIDNTKSLGLKLVNSWIAQLNGNLEIRTSSQGTEFKIAFTDLD